VKLADIKPGRWYATRVGMGECLRHFDGAVFFKIDGRERIVHPRDVYGETKKPEGAP
jgi:hypothetical protein